MGIQDRFDLHGRTALVTGGGRGIGRRISQVLAEAGASLMLVGRDSETLTRAQFELSSTLGARVKWVSADLSDRSATEHAAAVALREYGSIDILVHCAGVPADESLENLTDNGWDKVIETNLFAAAALTRAFLPRMKEKRWGRVIYISSAASQRAYANGRHAAYSASKSGLQGLMQTVATEMGPFGVTANCIIAGIFRTDMALGVASEQGIIDALANQAAVGRVGEASEMEGPVLLLAGDAGSYITGSLLYVDGGYCVLK